MNTKKTRHGRRVTSGGSAATGLPSWGPQVHQGRCYHPTTLSADIIPSMYRRTEREPPPLRANPRPILRCRRRSNSSSSSVDGLGHMRRLFDRITTNATHHRKLIAYCTTGRVKKKKEVFLISDVFCWLIRFLFASQSFALLSLVDDVIRVARRPLPSLVELPQIERRT